MKTSNAISFRHLDATGARKLADDVIVPVYEAGHRDVLDEPFYTTERFLERLQGYTVRQGFELVVADPDSGRPVGLAFDYPLPPTTRWWDGLIKPAPDGLTAEDGKRTFALNQIMVHPDWQRRGIARALHDELMSGRPEQRATLLAEPDNTLKDYETCVTTADYRALRTRSDERCEDVEQGRLLIVPDHNGVLQSVVPGTGVAVAPGTCVAPGACVAN